MRKLPIPLTLLALAAAGPLLAGPLLAQAQGGTLFPQPFAVEHLAVQTDGDGTTYYGDPVTDTYGGTWIVSERSDGSRLVVDLARREITEIRPDRGAYWTVSFGRLAEIRQRFLRIEEETWAGLETARGKPVPGKGADKAEGGEQSEPEIVFREPAAGAKTAASPAGRPDPELPEPARALLGRAGVRRLQVSVGGADKRQEEPAVEVWLDPRVRLTAAALDALERFEADVLGAAAADKSGAPSPARLVAAARAHAGGAFPIRTLRPLREPGAEQATFSGDGRQPTMGDLALRLEPLDGFSLDLVRVPEGLRRTTHPYEAMLEFAERELEREREMGRPVAGSP